MLPCIMCLISHSVLSAETVRSRASEHFDSILWTRNAASVQHTAPEGRNIPGGSESFASMVLAKEDNVPGLYPQIERLGILDYRDTAPNLLGILEELAVSLKKKTVPESLLRSDRKFLSTITVYRLRKVPVIEHVFFSPPGGTETTVRKSMVSLQTKLDGNEALLFIVVEVSYNSGLWKITDIQFDSESYAQFFVAN